MVMDNISNAYNTYGYDAHFHFNLYIPNDPTKHVGYGRIANNSFKEVKRKQLVLEGI